MTEMKKLLVSDSRTVDGKYDPKEHRLYVESEEDATVLRQYWFNDVVGTLAFVPVGGSTQVVKSVKNDRRRRIHAYGLVDRDALISGGNNEWALFFEEEDEVFSQHKPFGSYVHVLRCWEMESYLLHPDAVGRHLLNSRCIDADTDVLAYLFSLLSRLIPVLAGKLYFHAYGLPDKSIPVDLGKKKTPLAVTRGVSSIIDRHRHDVPDTSDDAFNTIPGSSYLRYFIWQLRRFGNGHPKKSMERWLAWIRILDAKALLMQIFGLDSVKSNQKDVRFHLAYAVRESRQIQSELANLINKAKEGLPLTG